MKKAFSMSLYHNFTVSSQNQGSSLEQVVCHFTS